MGCLSTLGCELSCTYSWKAAFSALYCRGNTKNCAWCQCLCTNRIRVCAESDLSRGLLHSCGRAHIRRRTNCARAASRTHPFSSPRSSKMATGLCRHCTWSLARLLRRDTVDLSGSRIFCEQRSPPSDYWNHYWAETSLALVSKGVKLCVMIDWYHYRARRGVCYEPYPRIPLIKRDLGRSEGYKISINVSFRSLCTRGWG